MPTGNLPAAGKKIWEEVYNQALKGSCKDNSDPKGCAAGSAWKAVHNAGWKKDAQGKWHKSSFTEFSLRIERAAYDKATNERRWRAVASDTDEDSRQDSMSLELFNDFIERIQTGEPVPEEFRSDFWSGGMPYLSVSHYPDLNGDGVPGVVDAVYIDGSYLKAKGKFHDNPLGRKCFESICADLYGAKDETNDKVRISIAFLDWIHKHKSNGFVFEREDEDDICPECLKEIIKGESQGKIFLGGHLVHLAMTRVPVNKRTDMEVDKSMADIKTRKDDAASIVGDELAEELEEKAKLVGKSEVLVIRSDEENDTVLEEKSELVEKESIPVAVTQPVAVEVVEPYRPFAGATSLKDALALKDVKEIMWDIEDLWYMTQDIKDNIMEDDTIEDKATAINDLLDEFKSQIKSLSQVTIEEAKTKTVNGQSYPPSDFLVVEDSNKPSTWHLQVKKHGKPDHKLMAAARAALTSNHRGNPYGGPKKASALAKLKRLYSSEKMTWESEVEEAKVTQEEVPGEAEEECSDNVTGEVDQDCLAKKRKETEMTSEVAQVQTMSKADFDNIISTIRSTISESINLVVKPVEPTQHPLDAAFNTFKAAYDQIDAMAGNDEKERLQFIQEPFNQLGQAIVGVLKASVKKSEPEPTIEAPAGDLATVLSKAISDAMNPIAQKLDMVSAQLQSKVDQRVPPRRSIEPSSAPQTSVAVSKSETPKLRAIIERTTQ